MKVENVTYRTLVAGELNLLLPALQKLGWSIPHPHLSSAIVAECDGNIVGFAVMQMVFHAEPVFVQPEFRGTGIAEDLADQVRKVLDAAGAKAWVAVAQNEFAAGLCERVGMKPVPGTIYRKES